MLGKRNIRVQAPEGEDNWQIPEAPYALEPFTNHPAEGIMPLGSYSYSHSYSRSVVAVGRYCSIGEGLVAFGNTHPIDWASTSPVFYQRRKLREWGGDKDQIEAMAPFVADDAPITIGNDVWIGDGVRIKQGITIGDGAIIAVNSLVTKDVAPYSIVGGVPARLIRMRFESSMIDTFLEVAWWKFGISDIIDLQPEDPQSFLRSVQTGVKDGWLHEMPEERVLLRDILRNS